MSHKRWESSDITNRVQQLGIQTHFQGVEGRYLDHSLKSVGGATEKVVNQAAA